MRSPSSRGSTQPLEVLAILDDPRDQQRHADPLGDVDRLSRSLVRVDPPEEQQVSAVAGAEIELADVDPVVDRRRVVKAGVPIGIADRDVVPDVVVALVDRQDPLRREAVDRRDHRGRHQTAVGQGKEVEAVVDHVELISPLERSRDVQSLAAPSRRRSVPRRSRREPFRQDERG